MKVFITGHKGQLGRALQTECTAQNIDFAGGDLPDWDMLNLTRVSESLDRIRPDVVIHAGALTQVDYCAEHPQEAVLVNGVGTYNVCVASRAINVPVLAISTNEVFDGRATRPYQEYDQRNPINAYGYSKFVAEQVVERYAPAYMIVRTAWLYAPGGVNFIHKIVERARKGEALHVVTDEVSSPTHVNDLARAIVHLAQLNRPGIYHMTNAGECSRFEFAQEILRLWGLDAVISPITLAEFQRPSTPPPYAPLANVFGAAAGVEMRDWREALAEYAQQGRGQAAQSISHPA